MEPVALAALFAAAPDGGPMAERLYRAVRDAAREGRLPAGELLPSSRAAAAALGLGRNTVSAAYDLLRAEGVVDARQGAAPRVLPVAPPAPAPAPVAPAALGARGAALAADPRSGLYARADGWLMPGRPDEALFPRAAWARALRRAASALHGPAAGYAEYGGLPALRTALAARLAADRGVAVPPARILVTAGAQAALTLAALTLAEPDETALVETPGYAGARGGFAAAGLRVAPLPVDAQGADVAAAAPEARLAYVTPSNQYPLGVRMSLARRQALADWARAQRAWIVEDDYDSEFHWRGRAIAALQALAPDVTVYVGSSAKSLAPALRLGWLVAPEGLAAPMAQAHRNLGMAANLHAQAALAALMESGAWRAHQRRIAGVYAARGRFLADALEARFGDRLTVRRPDGGLQLAAVFAPGLAEAPAMARLGAAGFAVAALSGYGGGPDGPQGLVIGFADAEQARVARLVATLAPALEG
jgi:GntR family transcriptional regulator/MocR family aminotransferase